MVYRLDIQIRAWKNAWYQYKNKNKWNGNIHSCIIDSLLQQKNAVSLWFIHRVFQTRHESKCDAFHIIIYWFHSVLFATRMHLNFFSSNNWIYDIESLCDIDKGKDNKNSQETVAVKILMEKETDELSWWFTLLFVTHAG